MSCVAGRFVLGCRVLGAWLLGEEMLGAWCLVIEQEGRLGHKPRKVQRTAFKFLHVVRFSCRLMIATIYMQTSGCYQYGLFGLLRGDVDAYL